MLGSLLALVLVAPFVGSFLGVLVRRLPAGRPVVLARSACEACGAALGPAELVPLLSHAWLRGRCRRCGAAIAAFHWRIELAAALVAVSAAWADPGRAWVDCCFGWTLLALAWIDAETWRLPDVLTLPLVLAGLAEAWGQGVAADHAVAAALGFLAFTAVAAAYRWRRGREGMGAGDAKLLAAIGAWVGLEGLAPVVLGAALLGIGWAGAVALADPARRLSGGTAIPFGPCLALAGWLVLLAW